MYDLTMKLKELRQVLKTNYKEETSVTQHTNDLQSKMNSTTRNLVGECYAGDHGRGKRNKS